MRILTYVINLDRSTDRLAAVSSAMQAQGIEFTRIRAVDGRQLSAEQLAAYDDTGARAYYGRSLRTSEIACFLSHLKALSRFVESEAEYCMIFEDDARPCAGFLSHINNILLLDRSGPILDGRWDVIHLGADRLKSCSRLYRLEDGRDLVLAHYFPMRCVGLLWSRRGALRMLDSARSVHAPIDVHLRQRLGITQTGLAVWPASVAAAPGPSDIETAGKRSAEGRRRFYTLHRLKRNLRERARASRAKISFQLRGAVPKESFRSL